MPGPLDGIAITELAGLGPAPFAGMVLSDLGARVIRVDRKGGGVMFPSSPTSVLDRGRESIAVDLKSDEGVEVVLRCVERSDALIEGFRPGVAERLGIGPAECLARNSALVYGRMTGWGQDGPWSRMAGHDIDYIAMSGVLHAIGPVEEPVPPLNLVGDFGGGGMLLVVGLLAAIISARESGEGQVVDAAMVDGSALLSASHHGYMAEGWWHDEREDNLLDGAAPFYTTYVTKDGRHVAVGALEPQFFGALVEGLGLAPEEVGPQNDRHAWPSMRRLFASVFVTKTRDEWAEHFVGTDACVAPVLSMREAPDHPHNTVRSTFVEVAGVTQPAPAPRFSKTPARISNPPAPIGSDTDLVLTELGFSPDDIGTMRESGVVA